MKRTIVRASETKEFFLGNINCTYLEYIEVHRSWKSLKKTEKDLWNRGFENYTGKWKGPNRLP